MTLGKMKEGGEPTLFATSGHFVHGGLPAGGPRCASLHPHSIINLASQQFKIQVISMKIPHFS